MEDDIFINELKELYQLTEIKLIGSGGFKQVFKIKKSDHYEVLKIIDIETNKESKNTQRNRILQEIEILKKCDSDFLVKLGSIIPATEKSIQNKPYIIYSEEFLNGQDLQHLLHTNFNWKEIKRLIICICQALQELHQKNIIHRDIKPANIMKLDNPDRPYVLIDLGIVYSIDSGGLTTQQFPHTIGTPGYIAPELSTEYYKEHLGPQVDIYSLGVTLYEVIASKRPVKMEDIIKIKGFPDELFDLLKKCIKEKSVLRPDTGQILQKIQGIE